MAVFMRKIYMLIATCFRLVYLRVTRGKRKRIVNGKVLLMIGGGLGDTIIFASAYFAIVDYYEKQGKTVYIYCSSSIGKILSSYYAERGLNIIEIGQKNHLRSEMKRISSEAGGIDFEKIILWGSGIHMSSISANLNANEKYGSCADKKNTRANPLEKIYKSCITELFSFSTECELYKMAEDVLHWLGIVEYHYRFFALPKLSEHTAPFSQYITVAVDSSSSSRRWDSSKFINLIHTLLDKYETNVCIVGTNVDAVVIQEYKNAFVNDPRCRLMIRPLAIDEWIELIRGSRFHIGVDSGSIHVAAAVGTPCFCLTGVWDGHRIMPYPNTIGGDGIKRPICVYRSDTDVDSLSCYGCSAETGKYGGGNSECRALCNAGKPCLCLAKIEVDDVIRAVEIYMRSVDK